MIQAILFSKKEYSDKEAKNWLKNHNYNFISNRITNNYRRYRLIEPNYRKYIYRIQHINNNISFIMQYKK